MAEIEELRAKVMASMASKNATIPAAVAAPTPTADANPKLMMPTASKQACKEDGEISSSSSGDMLGCTPSQSDADAPAVPSDAGLKSKQVQNPGRGKSLGAGNYGSSVQPLRPATVQQRMPTTQNYNVKKKPFAYKSGHNSWIAPSSSDDNLVIKFSDNDTDSESEDLKAAVSGKQIDTTVIGTSYKSSTANQQRKLSHNTYNSRLQTAGNRDLTKHSSVSSSIKAPGTFHKVPGIPVPGKDLQFQKQNVAGKLLPNKDQEFISESLMEKRSQNLHPETNLPEHKKYQKNINQNKRKTLDIHGDAHGPSNISIGQNATRFDRSASSDRLTTVDHSLKRQKVCEDSQGRFSSKEQSILPKSAKERNSEMNRKMTGDSSHGDTGARKQQSNLESFLVQTDLRYIPRQKDVDNAISVSAEALLSGGITKETSLSGSAIPVASNWRNSTLNSHQYSCDLSCGSLQLDRTMQGTSSRLVQDSQLQNLLIYAKDASNHQKSSEPLEPIPDVAHFQSNPFMCMGREMDIESLINLEEIKDKELEEAQEHRRKCELEERRAFKAYRKAQRDLIVANEKCSLLYRARELFSAQFRAFAMEGSNSLWSSRSLADIGNAFKSVESRENEISRLCYEVQTKDPKVDAVNSQYRTNIGRSNTGCIDLIDNSLSHQHMLGGDLRSEQNLDPDITNSPEYDSTNVNRADTANESNLVNRSKTSQLAGEEVGEKMVSVDVASEMPPCDDANDYELEANLRSKLFERLRKKAIAGTHDSNMKAADYSDKADDNSLGHTGTLSSIIHIQVCEDHKKKEPDVDIAEIPEFSSHAVDRWHPETTISDAEVSVQNPFAQREAWHVSLPSLHSMPSAALIVVSKNLKQILLELNRAHDEVSVVPRGPEKDVHAEFQGTISNVICIKSFSYDGGIDPFRPFCMFELRGKCNNEECSMQHLKDCCTSWSQTEISNQARPTSGVKHCSKTSSEGLTVMNKASRGSFDKQTFIPSYQIGSIHMKTELQPAGILLSQSNWLYWQMWFCTSFLLPFSIQRLPTDAPNLQEAELLTDSENNSTRLNLHSQHEEMGSHVDVEQCLDVAFYHLNSKMSKSTGRRKALSVLSRALEANPESSVIWIVYLHMYYGKEKELGKDDMFMHAVQNCKDSYELWLMYINSRMQLQSRMNAYEEALSVLCSQRNISEEKRQNGSACVLDLFLQMINFLCMSGNAETAIARIHELPNPSTGILPDILSNLIFSDRCVFWVCCIFLVVYRKLPEVIVQQFEFEKDISFGIDWPPIQLVDSEKQQALEIMKMALEAVEVNFDSCTEKSEYFDNTYLRLLHLFAVNLVEFIGAIEGPEGATNLLDEYISKYPTCIELFVLKSKCQKLLHDEFGFEIFEKALLGWPDGTPGIHCLWNQYATYALDCNKIDIAKELIDRWLSCCGQDANLSEDRSDGSSNSAHFILVSPDAYGYLSTSEDATFKSLNNWLQAVLQKDRDKARQVIDKALKEVSPSLFKHCVREHAVFYHSTAADSSNIRIPTLLSYLRDIRAPSVLHPLSRRFCENIKKPRIRHLINKLLGPVSQDCSLLNSILEECHGPSLLHEDFNEPKDLVDYIEAIIDISPANYRLAMSAHRLVVKSYKDTTAFPGLTFWSSSIMVNSLLQAFPVAPEHAWLEVASLLGVMEIPPICEKFHQHALSVYPFSIGLWRSYYRISKLVGDCCHVIEAAKIRGFELTE